MDLTDEQWSLVSPLLPACPKRRDGRGRPWRCNRAVLNGILWILRTGAPWHDLPDRYPSYQTCHRRFQRWSSDGTLERILRTLAHDLHERGGLDLSECFIDGLFVAAKKGTSAASWFDTNTMLKTTSALYNSDASSYCYGIYEIASKHLSISPRLLAYSPSPRPVQSPPDA